MGNSDKLARLQRTELRTFAQEVMDNWLEDKSLAVDDLEQLGLKHGLLVKVPAQESCGYGCTCYALGVFPTICLRFSSLLTGDRSDPSPHSDAIWAGMTPRKNDKKRHEPEGK